MFLSVNLIINSQVMDFHVYVRLVLMLQIKKEIACLVLMDARYAHHLDVQNVLINLLINGIQAALCSVLTKCQFRISIFRQVPKNV